MWRLAPRVQILVSAIITVPPAPEAMRLSVKITRTEQIPLARGEVLRNLVYNTAKIILKA